MRKRRTQGALAAFAGALIAALIAVAPAGATPVVVVEDGRSVVRDDPYLPADTGPEPGDAAALPDSGARCEDTAPARPPVPNERAQASASRGASVRKVLSDARRKRKISASKYREYRKAYDGARSTRRRLSGARRAELSSVIAVLERISARGQLAVSRMPALFLQLARNAQYWRTESVPQAPTVAPSKQPCFGGTGSGGARVTFGDDPILFQWYRGKGLQIQPLGNFGKVNALWSACAEPTPKSPPCKREDLRRYLDRMVDIASSRGGFTTWEYFFHFGGGTPPWISGMAQGTGIQALSRGYQFLAEPRYLRVAKSALGAFTRRPPTGVRVAADGGAHYLLYSFDRRLFVLNGFLQSLIGIHDYYKLSGDARARELFEQGDVAARNEVPQYDTGAWSLYSRRGRESDFGYHKLVRDFLRRLCDRTSRSVYCETANKFTAYLRESPRVNFIGASGATEGRQAQVRFELSKISCVTIRISRDGSRVYKKTLVFGRGTRAFSWKPLKSGTYSVELTAEDLSRHKTEVKGTIEVG
jgi:hypothetical protein